MPGARRIRTPHGRRPTDPRHGETRVIVLTTFDDADFFGYEVTFAGTTPVQLQSFQVD